MNLKMTLKWILAFGLWLLASQASAQEAPALKTEKEKLSYAFGVDMARNFNQLGVQVDQNSLVMGFKDVFSGEKLLMTEVDLRATLKKYQDELKQGKVKLVAAHVSYAIGVDAARSFKRQGVEFDIDALAKGLRDAFSGGKLLLDANELRLTLSIFQNELRHRRTQARTRLAKDAARMKSGEAFLNENKTKEGVVTLPSGLQYKILRAGDGKKPTDADTVEVIYRGTLIDGTEFDSSPPGQPATFKVKGEVIPGWTEALQLMPVGSKWQIFVPPQLAYGDRGAGTKVGPNATLIFELELVAIK
jgi:FKBP-type peptidyl-prolyl cis-trans isomerase FklB